jgi:hypothetical protein
MAGSEGMSITIDVREVSLAAAELALGAEKVAQVLRTEIMAQSMRTIARVKTDMPVDTGRARASWGTPGEAHEAGDAVWRVEDGGLTVVQGSNVEYVPALNDGHSKQQPAGFIDRAAADADEELNRRVSDGLVNAAISRALRL